MLLRRKNALITGGSRGIGKAIAEEFLKEGAGVVIIARDPKELKKAYLELSKKYPKRIFAERTDVSKLKDVKKLRGKIKKHVGHIDILVNAAGIQGEIGSFTENNMLSWETALHVNLLGTAYIMHEFLPDMIKHGKGKIINFSGGGATGPRPFFSSYSASKTAVVRLTETVAEELQEKKIKIDINAIAPGAVNTRLLNELISAGSNKTGKKEYEEALKRTKSGGENPQKAARLAVFLASFKSDSLTGRLISAIYDTWQEIPKHKKEIMNSDIYTLRRIIPKDRGYTWK